MNVFISHSHKDKVAVDRIVRDLSTHGLQVWLGAEKIVPGEQLAERINLGIESAGAILIIISRNTDESRFQTSEIAFAIAAQRKNPSKLVIPVLIDQPARLPFFLQDILYCDLSSEEKYNSNFKNLVQALSRPQTVQKNLHDLDKRKMEAIAAEREMLKQEVEALTKKKRYWSETVISIIASSTTVMLIIIASSLFGLTGWLNQQSSRFADYILGALAGTSAALAGLLITSLLRKSAARKEAKDAKR